VHKPAALALFLIALAVLPAAAETFLLGGVLATAVVDDEESGLVNINGIHSSIFEVEVPYVADLWVYLRWEGEGEHTVDLEVVNADGDVVADLSEDVNFEEYATNFTTHDLANTVFEEEGTYVVVVYVDGEELLNLPYCVNDDSDVPDDPYLLVSLPAVDGWADDAGWGEVEGAFEHYTFERFPGADDFAIVTLWFSGDGSYEQRIEITDPAGTVIGKPEAQEVEAWPGELTVVTDYFENFLFKTPGDYVITVYLDDEEYLSYTLRAVLAE
jgi:hypothetical protein